TPMYKDRRRDLGSRLYPSGARATVPDDEPSAHRGEPLASTSEAAMSESRLPIHALPARFCPYAGECGSALLFVVSKNIQGHHLTESQRAIVAAKLKPLFAEEARQRQRAALRRRTEPPVRLNLAERDQPQRQGDSGIRPGPIFAGGEDGPSGFALLARRLSQRLTGLWTLSAAPSARAEWRRGDFLNRADCEACRLRRDKSLLGTWRSGELAHFACVTS